MILELAHVRVLWAGASHEEYGLCCLAGLLAPLVSPSPAICVLLLLLSMQGNLTLYTGTPHEGCESCCLAGLLVPLVKAGGRAGVGEEGGGGTDLHV